MSIEPIQLPFNRFVYVLSVVKYEQGEPCPELDTYSYYYTMDPYRVLAKSLKVMNDIRNDRINKGDDEFELDNELDTGVLTMDTIRKYQDPADVDRLFSVHERVSKYFLNNNNIHDGVYHMFVLHRYLIDDDHGHVKQRQVTINKATKEEVQQFFT